MTIQGNLILTHQDQPLDKKDEHLLHQETMAQHCTLWVARVISTDGENQPRELHQHQDFIQILDQYLLSLLA